MLPDAEALAGPLLGSLADRERIVPESIIICNDMRWEIEERSSRNNLNLNYPHGIRADGLFTLIETWQCLVCEGLVAPKPTHLARSTNTSSTE